MAAVKWMTRSICWDLVELDGCIRIFTGTTKEGELSIENCGRSWILKILEGGKFAMRGDNGGRVIKISKKRIIIIIIALEDGRSKKSDEDQNYLGSRNCERW